jgi:hypothetical protein
MSESTNTWVWGNSQPPPAKQCVFIIAGDSNSSEGGSSVMSTLKCQNSTRSTSLNNCRILDITQYLTPSLSPTQPQLINTPTATPCTSAPLGLSQTWSTHLIVSFPGSGIASTPTPLSCVKYLRTSILVPEHIVIISIPLRPWAADSMTS